MPLKKDVVLVVVDVVFQMIQESGDVRSSMAQK